MCCRRGYAAAAKSVAGGGGAMLKKQGGDEAAGGTKPKAWIPDPVTGYYRPENIADEIDVAELRRVLLDHKH